MRLGEVGRDICVAECATGAERDNIVAYATPPPSPPSPPPQPPVARAELVSECDPNYSGTCVPIASDVDCAGGIGNGPAYVQGAVYVVDEDIHDFDRDGDGVGCYS